MPFLEYWSVATSAAKGSAIVLPLCLRQPKIRQPDIIRCACAAPHMQVNITGALICWRKGHCVLVVTGAAYGLGYIGSDSGDTICWDEHFGTYTARAQFSPECESHL